MVFYLLKYEIKKNVQTKHQNQYNIAKGVPTVIDNCEELLTLQNINQFIRIRR